MRVADRMVNRPIRIEEVSVLDRYVIIQVSKFQMLERYNSAHEHRTDHDPIALESR